MHRAKVRGENEFLELMNVIRDFYVTIYCILNAYINVATRNASLLHVYYRA